VEVSNTDVLANVPYVPGCKLWFDHHSSETSRLGEKLVFEGDCRMVDSAARVIFDYYGGKEKLAQFADMVDAVDKVDSGKLTSDEILNPESWVLLGFIMDPRTGLGRFRNFSISNYELMERLILACAHMQIEEILAMPDVQERVKVYFEQDELFRDMLDARTRTDGNVIITDLRGIDPIYTGNRFVVYSLYPKQNVSVWVVDGRGKQNCPIAVGYSVLNRTCKTNVGALMLKYGGGGHKQVGTCQVPYEDADRVIDEIVAAMKQDDKAEAVV
jgi:nanoRNase/pAp phosphatase (c-di-AMP/oligoRNAs hydrolase)